MLRRVSIIYIAGVCLLSIIVQAAILPQFELRELDIFLQDDGYSQISRTKRTDNNGNSTIEEEQEESSGNGGVDETGINQMEANVTDNLSKLMSANLTSENEPLTTEISLVHPRSNDSRLIQTGSSTEANIPATTQSEGDSQSSATATEIVAIASTGIPVSESPTTESPRENVTQLIQSPIPPPLLPTRFGAVDPKLVTNINLTSTDDNTAPAHNSTDTIENPSLDNNSTVNETTTDSPGDNLQPPDNSPPVVQNATNTIINNTKSDAPDTIVTGGNQPTTPKNLKNSTDTTTTKPVVGGSDASNKASVSGSGILFTIIILIVVAGLAGLGYYIYKKRQRGYDPVEIEDRDKEMTEIKTENGFGKPILAEEVKLQDQLTPHEPQPTPRTFGVASLHEAAFANVDVIREDSDRDRREQSVEFEEEGGKKDEKY